MGHTGGCNNFPRGAHTFASQSTHMELTWNPCVFAICIAHVGLCPSKHPHHRWSKVQPNWSAIVRPHPGRFTGDCKCRPNRRKFLQSQVSGCTLNITSGHLRSHTQIRKRPQNLPLLARTTEAQYVTQIHMTIYKTGLCHLGAWQVRLNFDHYTENMMHHLHHRNRPTPSLGLTYLTLKKKKINQQKTD